MQKPGNRYTKIINGILVTPLSEIRDGVVVIEGERIITAGRRGTVEEPAEATVIDAGGGYIIPGMIDIHVNGALGADVTKVEEDTFAVMNDFFVKHGTTAYLGTAITSADKDFINVLEHAKRHIVKGTPSGAELLGIHMEGPYLSVAQCGAHPQAFLKTPKREHWRQFLAWDDVLKMMTVAPELEGAEALVRGLRDHGVIASAGHTDGTYREIIGAVDAGITHSTHFFCNMSHFRRDNLKRVAGVVETLLADDRVSAGLIADGWHVGPQLMRLLVGVKGVDKVCLVTDAMPAVGLPDGLHRIGDVEAVVENGIARLPDGSAYAGSVATMDICLRNSVKQIGLALNDAVRMATLTPAEIIGAGDRLGSIEKGKDADIAILDKALNVRKTISKGRMVYEI